MMMKAHQIQTPKKEHQLINRRSKPSPELSKKPLKVIVNKCLDPAFASSSEDDVALESLEGSLQNYQLSEILEDHLLDDTDESFLALDTPLPVSSQESSNFSDLTPSSASTVTNHLIGDNSSNRACIVPMEADILAKYLSLAQEQVNKSTDIDLLSKKLVHKLIKTAIENFLGLPDEDDRFDGILSMKFGSLNLSFLVVLLGFVVFFLFSGEQSSFKGPLPT